MQLPEDGLRIETCWSDFKCFNVKKNYVCILVGVLIKWYHFGVTNFVVAYQYFVKRSSNAHLYGSKSLKSPRTPIYRALQPQKPKGVLLHGSTATESQGLTFIWLHRPQKPKNSHLCNVSVPKTQGLRFIRLYSHRRPRTSFHMALQDI